MNNTKVLNAVGVFGIFGTEASGKAIIIEHVKKRDAPDKITDTTTDRGENNRLPNILSM
jgi:hypothetical protein